MAELLEALELAEHHGVAQVDVGRGGIHAELDAQRRSILAKRHREALAQLVLAVELDRALAHHGELTLDFDRSRGRSWIPRFARPSGNSPRPGRNVACHPPSRSHPRPVARVVGDGLRRSGSRRRLRSGGARPRVGKPGRSSRRRGRAGCPAGSNARPGTIQTSLRPGADRGASLRRRLEHTVAPRRRAPPRRSTAANSRPLGVITREASRSACRARRAPRSRSASGPRPASAAYSATRGASRIRGSASSRWSRIDAQAGASPHPLGQGSHGARRISRRRRPLSSSRLEVRAVGRLGSGWSARLGAPRPDRSALRNRHRSIRGRGVSLAQLQQLAGEVQRRSAARRRA